MKKFIITLSCLLLSIFMINTGQAVNHIGMIGAAIGGHARPTYVAGSYLEAQSCGLNVWRPSVPDFKGDRDWQKQDNWLNFVDDVENGVSAGLLPYFVIEMNGAVRNPNRLSIRPEFLEPTTRYSLQDYLADLIPILAQYSHIVQLGNEPQAFGHDVRGYVEYSIIAYQTIKKLNPAMQVVSGPSENCPDGYDFVGEFLKLLSQPCFDAMDVHCFSHYRNDLVPRVNRLRQIFAQKGWSGISIHSTENGTFTGSRWGLPFQTEQMQAADNFKRIVLCLSLDINVIMYPMGIKEFLYSSGPNDPYGNDWAGHGIIFDGIGDDDAGDNVRKISFYTTQIAMEKLTEVVFIRVTMPATGIYQYQFRKADGKRLWVIWYDRPKDSPLAAIKVSLGAMPNLLLTPVITSVRGARYPKKLISNSNLVLEVAEQAPLILEER